MIAATVSSEKGPTAMAGKFEIYQDAKVSAVT